MKILVIILLCMIPGLIVFPLLLPKTNKDIYEIYSQKKWSGWFNYIYKSLLFSVIWPLLEILYVVAIIAEKYHAKRNAYRELKGFINGDEEESINDGKLRFCHMGGAVTLHCNICGYEEKIICFLHGFERGPNAWHESGYQCQHCGRIISIEMSLRLKKVPPCDCGGELSMEEPLFYPVCKSFSLGYKMRIIT